MVATAVLHLWSWHPSVPLSYSTDALYYDGVVKGTLDHGWYLNNPDLGAPFGLASHDFPVVSNDSLQLVIVKGIGIFTSRPFLASNIFFVLTFPLNAIGAFAALRWRRTPPRLAVLGAAIFGILPLSFMKGIDYLFFISAYMVPISCAMVLTVLAGEPLLRRRPGAAGLRSLASPWNGFLVLLCAAIASASVYYAVFTAILLGSAALGRSLLSRTWRALAEGLGAAALIGAFAVLNQLPTILYRLHHGANPIVAVRDPAESEFYGLKLIQLFLPAPGHRIRPLADLTDRYLATTKILGEPSISIGLLATVGLAWLLVVALGSTLGSERSSVGSPEERNAAFCVVLTILWTTTGGIAAIVSYTLTPQLRGWSRMSIFLAFFGLFGALRLLERLRGRLPTDGARPLFAAILAGVFLLAALDQTSGRFAPDRTAIEREYHADADFVQGIEARMPAGSAILQLPYVAYPEVPPTHRLGAYDELRPYLHSTRLRWSFGAMKGRPQDWHAELTNGPFRSLLAGAVAGGLTGLVFDRFGYSDRGAALEAELASLVGPPALVGATDRMAFWDLRPLGERLEQAGEPMARLGELALHPIRLSFDDGFYQEEAQSGVRWRWLRGPGVITVDNPDAGPREAMFSVDLRSGQPGTGTTTLELPDGTTETRLSDSSERDMVRRSVQVPPGRSTIRVESAAQPGPERPDERRRLVVQLFDLVLVPVELCRAAAVLGAPDREGGCLDDTRAHRP